ncbi:hypothetical protein QFZ37_001952 [Chryseobacterium ginsenosidimutans]|uniref:hypothetical protein n=1 Tax=Chryseobacterium ginsenosidimutans TaxID=687846 RepID=UPI0027854769|nr:hypothetical protein [Chryseobacterium ginsenosidimutans]MDQ0593583.1 hypothetical protein [Chryseobacterium ginsenosidimutans]
MINKIKICLLSVSFIFSSCHSQDSKYVDLEKISDNFDVSAFYKNRLKKTNDIISTNPKNLDKKTALKLLDNAFFIKDTLGYYKTEGRFPTELFLESTNEWMVRNKKPVEIFGFGYKTVAYDPDKDTLAILNTVSFPKIDMVEDKKGNLMYLEVGKTAKNIAEFNKIKDYISKNCKKITVDDNDQNVSYWEGKFFYYYLSKEDNKEEEISYDSQGNKKSKWKEVTEIRLAMFGKSYIKKMEDLRIYSAGNKFWKKSLY